MSCYVIAHIDVTDPRRFRDYQVKVPGTIAAHGGRYLVRGGTSSDVEGAMPYPRHVVLEFPDRATAEGWYNSPEYQEILAIRLASAEGSVTIVDGYDAP